MQENSLINAYQQLVENSQVIEDAAQKIVLEKLQDLKNAAENYFSKNDNVFSRLLKPNKCDLPNGIYIFGDVGSGKSMLMDLFFENIQIKQKRRVHFHAFMIEIHKMLYRWRQENRDNVDASDPIPQIAKDICGQANILCFDEMQVTDIADAMILGRLFSELFDNEIIIISTSNRHPDDLYKNGLQRERFIPFLDLLKTKMQATGLNADQDYRLSHLKSLSTVYSTPLGKKSDKFLKEVFCGLTNNAKAKNMVLEVDGREVYIAKTHGDVAWVSFADLCDRPLGAADYIEIAREFSTLLISNIPKMTRDNRNEAKRFCILIDELYERKVKLICSADSPPDQLYEEGDGSFEFERTASRLIEMQSEQYLKEAHAG